jgi:hypothetical protein
MSVAVAGDVSLMTRSGNGHTGAVVGIGVDVDGAVDVDEAVDVEPPVVVGVDVDGAVDVDETVDVEPPVVVVVVAVELLHTTKLSVVGHAQFVVSTMQGVLVQATSMANVLLKPNEITHEVAPAPPDVIHTPKNTAEHVELSSHEPSHVNGSVVVGAGVEVDTIDDEEDGGCVVDVEAAVVPVGAVVVVVVVDDDDVEGVVEVEPPVDVVDVSVVDDDDDVPVGDDVGGLVEPDVAVDVGVDGDVPVDAVVVGDDVGVDDEPVDAVVVGDDVGGLVEVDVAVDVAVVCVTVDARVEVAVVVAGLVAVVDVDVVVLAQQNSFGSGSSHDEPGTKKRPPALAQHAASRSSRQPLCADARQHAPGHVTPSADASESVHSYSHGRLRSGIEQIGRVQRLPSVSGHTTLLGFEQVRERY